MSPEILKTLYEASSAKGVGEIPKFENGDQFDQREGLATEVVDENIPRFDDDMPNEASQTDEAAVEDGDAKQAHLDVDSKGFDQLQMNEASPTPETDVSETSWEEKKTGVNDETGKVVYEVRGGKHCPHPDGPINPDARLLNHPPFPENAEISVRLPDDSVVRYETDDKGDVVRVRKQEMTVSEYKLRDGNETPKTKYLKDGLPNDEGGHIVGDQFGGSSEQINLEPMSHEVNHPTKKNELGQVESDGTNTWGDMEKDLRKELDEGNKVTNFDVKIYREGDSKRPTAFEVQYEVTDKNGQTEIRQYYIENTEGKVG